MYAACGSAALTLGPILKAAPGMLQALNLRLLPLRGTGELRQRDSKSLRPLRADRADAITCARNGMLEYWNADVLGFRTSIHYSILPIFNLSGLNFQQLAA
jgi:hypothetical protein